MNKAKFIDFITAALAVWSGHSDFSEFTICATGEKNGVKGEVRIIYMPIAHNSRMFLSYQGVIYEFDNQTTLALDSDFITWITTYLPNVDYQLLTPSYQLVNNIPQ
jgi:hypothetical protein